jgi:hypothetical protein
VEVDCLQSHLVRGFVCLSVEYPTVIGVSRSRESWKVKITYDSVYVTVCMRNMEGSEDKIYAHLKMCHPRCVDIKHNVVIWSVSKHNSMCYGITVY